MMAILLKKKPVEAREPAWSEHADLIDNVAKVMPEIATLTAEIKAAQEKLKKHKPLLEQLQKAVDALDGDADLEVTAESATNLLTAGARGTKREIKDIQIIRKAMGDKTFFELASVALGKIDDYLTPPQKEQALTVSRTGRNYTIVKKQ